MDIYKQYWEFLKARESAPLKLPVLCAYDISGLHHKSPHINKITSCIKQCATLLDIGAGDKRLKETLEKASWPGEYFSLDIDNKFSHNYDCLEKVDREFDCIAMLEVLEHLNLRDGINYIENAYRLLKPGGIFIISTPNIRHINAFWAADITHIRPWPHRDLYAILRLAGFESAEIFRIRLLNRLPTIKDNLKFILSQYICAILGADCAQGIMAIVRK